MEKSTWEKRNGNKESGHRRNRKWLGNWSERRNKYRNRHFKDCDNFFRCEKWKSDNGFIFSSLYDQITALIIVADTLAFDVTEVDKPKNKKSNFRMKLHWYRNGIAVLLSKNINMAINVFKYQFCVKRKFRKWLLYCTFVYILSHHLIQISKYYMPSDTPASYIAQDRIPQTVSKMVRTESFGPTLEISKVLSDSVGQIELKISPWNLPRYFEFSRIAPYIWQVNIQIKTDNARLFKKTQPFSGKVENLGNLTEIRKKLGTKIYNGNKFPERNDTIIVGKSIIT